MHERVDLPRQPGYRTFTDRTTIEKIRPQEAPTLPLLLAAQLKINGRGETSDSFDETRTNRAPRL